LKSFKNSSHIFISRGEFEAVLSVILLLISTWKTWLYGSNKEHLFIDRIYIVGVMTCCWSIKM